MDNPALPGFIHFSKVQISDAHKKSPNLKRTPLFSEKSSVLLNKKLPALKKKKRIEKKKEKNIKAISREASISM